MKEAFARLVFQGSRSSLIYSIMDASLLACYKAVHKNIKKKKKEKKLAINKASSDVLYNLKA